MSASGDYAVTLLSDAGADAMKAFGLAFQAEGERFQKLLASSSGETHHLIPVPAVYIVDETRKVRFQYVNPDFKVRIDPQTVLAAARFAAE